jgi:hypothetical protein
MKRPRHSSYPMAIEEAEELAAELSEFGYRETDDADEADRRRYYKVEKWTRGGRVDRTLYALQVKPVGVTNVAHGFSRDAPYLCPWRLFFCVPYRHRLSPSSCPGKPSPNLSVSSTCASIIVAGRSPAWARRRSSAVLTNTAIIRTA